MAPLASLLYTRISAVCPIIGVQIGTATDKATWSIVFDAAATAQQKTNAQAIITNWDAATQLDADKDAMINQLNGIAALSIDVIVFTALFNHENRIRTLAGQANITVAQFKAGIKALL